MVGGLGGLGWFIGGLVGYASGEQMEMRKGARMIIDQVGFKIETWAGPVQWLSRTVCEEESVQMPVNAAWPEGEDFGWLLLRRPSPPHVPRRPHPWLPLALSLLSALCAPP